MQVGNLLPDLLRPAECEQVRGIYQAGIMRHRQIDAFTDRHPGFRQSARRITGGLRRYGPIIVDVFYDHILSREWSRYSAVSRGDFIGDFHRQLESCLPDLPAAAADRLRQIRAENRLGSYHEPAGVAAALQRIGQRLRHPVPLEEAAPLLQSEYAAFEADFSQLFTDLLDHLEH